MRCAVPFSLLVCLLALPNIASAQTDSATGLPGLPPATAAASRNPVLVDSAGNVMPLPGTEMAATRQELVPPGPSPSEMDWGPACATMYDPSATNWGDGYPVEVACFRPADSVFYAQVDFLSLMRDPFDTTTYQSASPGGTTVLDSDKLEFPFTAGMRVLVGKPLNEQLRVEAMYWGLHDWNETCTALSSNLNNAGTLGNLQSPFSNFGQPPIAGLDNNNFASISLNTEVHNAELNLVNRFGLRGRKYETAGLIGARYFNVDEAFRYRTTSNSPANSSNTIDIATSNDLFGVQLGAMLYYSVSSVWWWEFGAKGGVYTNATDLRSVWAQDLGAGPATSINTANDRDTAFIGDLNLVTSYQFTRYARMRLGYQATWVDGLALAGDNLERDVNLLRQGPLKVNDNSTVVYHGPMIGLEVGW